MGIDHLRRIGEASMNVPATFRLLAPLALQTLGINTAHATGTTQKAGRN
ncbi:MAG: hypothetical protein ACREPY_14110 [Rhodanobacteraceae bacterium]